MKRLFFCFYVITLFFSCNTLEETESLNSLSNNNFFGLDVGNSWVYKNYKYNPNTGSYIDTGVIDSVKIIDKKIISGISYFEFKTKTSGNESGITFCNPNGIQLEYLRESDGSLISNDGHIKFTYNNFNERLLKVHQWGTVYETLVEGSSILNVEAGEFKCINSERYSKNLDNHILPGLDRFYYAKGVGLIYDTSSFATSSNPTIIRRLYSYKIN